MKTKYFFIAILSVTLSSCDSGNDDLNVDLTGDYRISAPSFTQLATDGTPCGRGEGTLNIADNNITGSVLSNGVQFNVTGTVRSNGDVTGGFALSEQTLVDFEGSFTNDFVGFGSWLDNGGCNGAWQAIANP